MMGRWVLYTQTERGNVPEEERGRRGGNDHLKKYYITHQTSPQCFLKAKDPVPKPLIEWAEEDRLVYLHSTGREGTEKQTGSKRRVGCPGCACIASCEPRKGGGE